MKFKLVNLLLSTFLCYSLMAQTEQSSPDINESYQEAMEEFSQAIDTLDFSKIFDEGFGQLFDLGPNQGNMNGLIDSLDLNQFFGDSGFGMIQEQIQEMDPEQLNEMLDQSMKMMQQMDLSQFQSLLDDIDMGQLQKMFEGMDFEGFNFQGPNIPKNDGEDDGKGTKKMKKL